MEICSGVKEALAKTTNLLSQPGTFMSVNVRDDEGAGGLMPRGPKGEKRNADVIGNAVLDRHRFREAGLGEQSNPEKANVAKDWVGSSRTFIMAWGLPTTLILIGLLVDPAARTIFGP
jgi:hypothetical protein